MEAVGKSKEEVESSNTHCMAKRKPERFTGPSIKGKQYNTH
jgi:hypothetical protein